ncbi:MAG: hypothetical protein Q7S22_08580 [Candidatus Micrarchaeota archaeon]|nr:hypothetical protein [Candidatus Micrarchaeota archaeon]
MALSKLKPKRELTGIPLNVFKGSARHYELDGDIQFIVPSRSPFTLLMQTKKRERLAKQLEIEHCYAQREAQLNLASLESTNQTVASNQKPEKLTEPSGNTSVNMADALAAITRKETTAHARSEDESSFQDSQSPRKTKPRVIIRETESVARDQVYAAIDNICHLMMTRVKTLDLLTKAHAFDLLELANDYLSVVCSPEKERDHNQIAYSLVIHATALILGVPDTNEISGSVLSVKDFQRKRRVARLCSTYFDKISSYGTLKILLRSESKTARKEYLKTRLAEATDRTKRTVEVQTSRKIKYPLARELHEIRQELRSVARRLHNEAQAMFREWKNLSTMSESTTISAIIAAMRLQNSSTDSNDLRNAALGVRDACYNTVQFLTGESFSIAIRELSENAKTNPSSKARQKSYIHSAHALANIARYSQTFMELYNSCGRLCARIDGLVEAEQKRKIEQPISEVPATYQRYQNGYQPKHGALDESKLSQPERTVKKSHAITNHVGVRPKVSDNPPEVHQLRGESLFISTVPTNPQLGSMFGFAYNIRRR